MEGRFAIRGCNRKTEEKKKKAESGLCSLPDEVAVTCLAQLSKPDLAAMSMTSKRYRSLTVSNELWELRYRMGWMKPSLYVCLHIFPEPSARWFILHPLQRRLKPIHLEFVDSSSSFVAASWGIYIVGGIFNGKPTATVSFIDCFLHKWYPTPSMRIPRASPSVSFIGKKLYVFGGCGDVVDSSKWAEVFDIETQTWEFLSLRIPRMPDPKRFNIRQTAVVDCKEGYAVDQIGRYFTFSPTSTFLPGGLVDPEHGDTTDWFGMGTLIFSRATRGAKIFWSSADEYLVWKEVKGLELSSLCEVEYDIIKLSGNGVGKLVIFWKPHPESFELWSAEISVEVELLRVEQEIWGKVEWSGAVFVPPSHSSSIHILYASPVLA